MKKIIILYTILCLAACNNAPGNTGNVNPSNQSMESTSSKMKHFVGAISNGMKGDSLSFDLSPDGKKLTNLTFNGWWRCSGQLERQPAAGTSESFDVVDGKVDGHISDPPDGGSTSWRFELKASITGNRATGSFRMNINNLGCDTYVLKFEALAR